MKTKEELEKRVSELEAALLVAKVNIRKINTIVSPLASTVHDNRHYKSLALYAIDIALDL